MEEDKKYKIILEDGTEIDDLTLNGNNFVTKEKVDKSIFDGNLGRVVISDGETEEVHDNMELAGILELDGYYYISLVDIPQDRLERLKIRSDIDYIAMMADINI